jgi:hypothetical protein
MPGRKIAVIAALLIILSLFPPLGGGAPPGQDHFVKGYVYDYTGNGVWNATVTVRVNGNNKGSYQTLYEDVGSVGYYKVNVGQGGDIYTGSPILVNVVYQGGFTASAAGTIDNDNAFDVVDVTISNLLVAPENLTVANFGSDIQLSWSAPNCVFDNYSIFISDGPDSFNFDVPDNKEEDETATTWAHVGQAGSGQNFHYVVRAVWDGFEELNKNKVGRYRMELDTGWNLISAPLQLEYTQVSELAADIDADILGTVDQIVRWTSNGWNSWIGVISWVNDFDLVASECYFVHVAGSGGTWLVEGTLHSSNLQLSLHYGWNPIAMPMHGAGTALASNVIAQVNAEHGAGTAIAISNWTGGGWDIYTDQPVDDFSLDDVQHPNFANGYGWFLRVSKNVDWTPA